MGLQRGSHERAGAHTHIRNIQIDRSFNLLQSSLVAQMVENLPARQETQVRSLSWEEPLEKGVATHSILA